MTGSGAGETTSNELAVTTAGPVIQAGAVHGGIHLGGAANAVVPRQLPLPPRWFAGRAAELAVLTALLEEAAESGATVVISAIGGAGGIGKTWLSVRWAHEQAARFPDGQLFVDLRGFSPSGEPMSAAEAMRGFLHALGEDPTKLPVDLDAQVGLYRSLVADRRMLIVLDNARDTAQVVPLLPGSRSCTVLVTSRRHLVGLVTVHGARSIDLNVLSAEEARQLLVDHLGAERVAAEPEAVAELLGCCAGLPLALSIVAARALTHPEFPLAALAEELRDQKTRLDGLNAGEIPLNLRAVFSWSVEALPDRAATLLALLGLAPGPDISLPAAAALAGLPVAETRALLRELETAHLVSQPVFGRYRFHDLLRLYAGEQGHLHLTEGSRHAALRRLLDFLLHTAHQADRLLNPHRHQIRIDPRPPDCHPLPLRHHAPAAAWLEAEHACLLAALHLAAALGWHKLVCQLAWSLDTFHYRWAHLHQWRTTWRLGLAAARECGDPAVLSLAHRLLGDCHLNLGEHDAALDQLDQALRVAEEADDPMSRAHAHRILTWAWGRRDDRKALEHAISALRLYRALGQPVREAAMLNAVGWFSTRLGDFHLARTHCQAALDLCRRHDYRVGEANTLASLGYLAQRTGRPHDALAHCTAALAVFRAHKATYFQADTLDRIGEIHAAIGQPEQARQAWQQALRLYRDKHRPDDADRVQRALDDLARSG
ncbi:tetratricopeptide repeat protein [Actinokineospora sp. NPDC004072]